jgi:NAD(P)-dependent dehydrogenase (short-subunit alcohol dehydrogenase family)
MIEFYRDKVVVVTGGCGMIGSQLVRKLSGLCHRVLVIDDLSRGQHVWRLENVHYLRADASAFDTCRYIFGGMNARAQQPVDVVFNLAAHVGGVFHNMAHQTEMFVGNIGLQSIPVLVAEQLGVPHFMQTSSVCVYAPEYNDPCLEEFVAEFTRVNDRVLQHIVSQAVIAALVAYRTHDEPLTTKSLTVIAENVMDGLTDAECEMFPYSMSISGMITRMSSGTQKDKMRSSIYDVLEEVGLIDDWY